MNLFAPSLLDKLLVGEGDAPGRGARMRMGIEQVKESVARDIEALLNARPGVEPGRIGDFPNAARSLLTFGLTDISSLSVASDRDRARIVEAIRRALAEHETRLAQVDVTVGDRMDAGGGLRFTIRANLRLSPESEPVAFDAVLQPGSARYAVSRQRLQKASGAP